MFVRKKKNHKGDTALLIEGARHIGKSYEELVFADAVYIAVKVDGLVSVLECFVSRRMTYKKSA